MAPQDETTGTTGTAHSVNVGSSAAVTSSAATSATPAAPADAVEAPKQRYIAYGEMVEVPEHDGTTAVIEQTYPEPRIVDELAPGQRGNLLPPGE